jgi:NAD(P)-dependent dehydrogenase (short-subunit alcohol dehydrogenase family)
MPNNAFEGQTVVVTGGGTGIGKATALAFAEQGAQTVIITGRRERRLNEVAELSPAIVPVVADLVSEEGAEAVATAVRARSGALDVLVHNAGIYRQTPIDAIDVTLARELLETNILGTALLTTRLLPLIKAPGGSIVLVSSVAGHKPEPYASVYAASKAGVHSLTLTWAKELAGRGIRVNAVAPSAVRTEVYAANGLTEEQTDQIFNHYAACMPLGRTGTVEDVTPWITKLAEPASSWVTGQIIVLDGGADLTSAADTPYSPYKWNGEDESADGASGELQKAAAW